MFTSDLNPPWIYASVVCNLLAKNLNRAKWSTRITSSGSLW